MAKHGMTEENKEILKIVATAWKELSEKDRAYWDEEARNDKVRFVREKAVYKGPWTIPKRRAKKHPMAPKVRYRADLTHNVIFHGPIPSNLSLTDHLLFVFHFLASHVSLSQVFTMSSSSSKGAKSFYG
jgi:hypothetical protein